MKNQRPTLAAANQFTPMTNKNVHNVETPMCFLKMGDLATPKLNKSINNSRDNKILATPICEVPKTQETEIDVDDEFASPKIANSNSSSDEITLSDLKALLITALAYIERLEKREQESSSVKSSYSDASTQTRRKVVRKSSVDRAKLVNHAENTDNVNYVRKIAQAEPQQKRKKSVSREKREREYKEKVLKKKEENKKEIAPKPNEKHTKPAFKQYSKDYHAYLSTSDSDDSLPSVLKKKDENKYNHINLSSSDSSNETQGILKNKYKLKSSSKGSSTDTTGSSSFNYMGTSTFKHKMDDLSAKLGKIEKMANF